MTRSLTLETMTTSSFIVAGYAAGGSLLVTAGGFFPFRFNVMAVYSIFSETNLSWNETNVMIVKIAEHNLSFLFLFETDCYFAFL